MQKISREQLRTRRDAKPELALIDVRGPNAFWTSHLPEARNIPLGEDFEEDLDKVVPDKDTDLVMYGSASDPDAVIAAARRAEGLGYRRVDVYLGGHEEWLATALPVISLGDQEPREPPD